MRSSPQRALPWGRLTDQGGPRMQNGDGEHGPGHPPRSAHLNRVPPTFLRGVGFSFLFAVPLILLVFSTFLVGGNVQTLVCQSWESGELYEVGLPSPGPRGTWREMWVELEVQKELWSQRGPEGKRERKNDGDG